MSAFNSKDKLRRCEALVNNEQLAREALNLRGVIKNMNLAEYLSGKNYVEKSHIKKIKKFKNDAYQSSL
jgi:hypothetical protein